MSSLITAVTWISRKLKCGGGAAPEPGRKTSLLPHGQRTLPAQSLLELPCLQLGLGEASAEARAVASFCCRGLPPHTALPSRAYSQFRSNQT